jgi:hypothetical protein
MVDVLGVHGISQQQLGRKQLLAPWSVALSDGVEFARGGREPEPTLDISFYGDFFLKATNAKGPEDLIEFDADTEAFFTDIQNEVVPEDEPTDLAEASKGMKELPIPVAKLASALERRFGLAGKLLFFGDLTQVRLYQRDRATSDKVLARVREGLDLGSPKVVVGHSLGSIVAYEALCLNPNHSVATLVTIGSPLGMKSIRDALQPIARDRMPTLPPGITRWVNIYDRSDPVALAGGLAEHWTDVTDRTVENDKEPHAATRYLSKVETGEAVVSTLDAS